MDKLAFTMPLKNGADCTAVALMFSASSMATPDPERFAQTLTPDNAILAMIDHQTGLMAGAWYEPGPAIKQHSGFKQDVYLETWCMYRFRTMVLTGMD